MADAHQSGEFNDASKAFAVLGQLADQVEQLHQSDQVHRHINPAATHVDSDGVAHLVTPGSAIEFGGVSPNLEQCPPELQTGRAVLLTSDASAASQTLSDAGIDVDPRRIDIYQLGTLLCRLLTNESVASYLRSPKTKAKVSPAVQELIDRSLGYEKSKAYQSVREFSAAIAGLQTKTAAYAQHRELLVLPGELQHDTTPKLSTVDVQSDTAAGLEDETRRQAAKSYQQLGEYEIIRLLGHGGMGDVYEGFDPRLRRRVAINVLPDILARDADFVRRFHGEASAAAQLIHPNVVQIFFIGEDKGSHFFVMEFVEGESVAELLARKNRLAVDETLAIVEQVLSGLSAAHQLGLVHRDIKPANLLIDRESQRVLLADFGLVKNAGSDEQMTATGVIMGTVDYISPEQGRGRGIDARSDLYSIGVLMYRMLSGQLPFKADSPTGMIFQHVYEEPTPLRNVAGDVPMAISELVTRLMAKSPDDRYQSCPDVLAALRSCDTSSETTQPSVATELPGETSVVKTVPHSDELADVPGASLKPNADSLQKPNTSELQHQSSHKPNGLKIRQWLRWGVAASVCLAGIVLAIWLTAGFFESKPDAASQNDRPETATPTPVIGQSIDLLREYELGNWRNVSPGRGHWVRNGGTFRMIPTPGSGADICWAYPLRTFNEFVVEMTFRVSGGGGIQIVFQARPDILEGKGVALSNKWIRGKSVGDLSIREVTTVPMSAMGDGKWHSLRIEVKQNLITAKLDGAEPVTWNGNVAPTCICIMGDEFQDWNIRGFMVTPTKLSPGLVYSSDDYQRDKEIAINAKAEQPKRLCALRDMSVHCSQIDRDDDCRATALQIAEDPNNPRHVRRVADSLAGILAPRRN